MASILVFIPTFDPSCPFDALTICDAVVCSEKFPLLFAVVFNTAILSHSMFTLPFGVNPLPFIVMFVSLLVCASAPTVIFGVATKTGSIKNTPTRLVVLRYSYFL